jgi:hypothetical protein
VPRPFVVEGEAIAVMADMHQATIQLHPIERRHLRAGAAARRLIRREQRVDGKDVLDVHQDQLLMLLLVVEAQFDERGRVAPQIVGSRLDQSRHPRLDMPAISGHVGTGRARQQPPLRPRMA